MLKISYKTNISFAKIIKDIKVKSERAESEVAKLGLETVETMRNFIKQGKVRPQVGQPTNLENNIDIESISEAPYTIGWGVGNIERLDREVSYWKAVNFGSSHLIGKKFYGFFQPGEEHPDISHFREGRFFEQKQFGWLMIPKNPIPPMSYIEKTVFWLDNQITKISSILKR